MRVRSLNLQRYGAFTDLSIPFGQAGLSLVVGLNEAGKSTALEALSDLLWGIPAGSGQVFLYGRQALALEACLQLPADEQVDVLRRSTGLTRMDTGGAVPCVWQTALDSRSRWRESFGLSHTELRDGEKRLCQGSGDLAELVFTARSGRVVRGLLAEVQRTADSLYKEHKGNKGVAVRQAYADYEQARSLVGLATADARWVQAARWASKQTADEVRQAEQRLIAARAAAVQGDQRWRAAPNARRLAEVQGQVATVFGTGVALDDQQLREFEEAQTQLAAADAAVAGLGGEFAQLSTERAGVVVEDAVLIDGEQIRRLHLESEARLEDGRHADQLLRTAATRGREAAVLLADLAGDTDPRPVPELLSALHVPADRVTQLNGLSEELQTGEQLLAVREDALQAATRRLTNDDVGAVDLETDAVAAVREAHDAIQAAGSALSGQRAAVEAHADGLRRRDEALRLAGLPTNASVPATVPSATAIRQAAELLTSANDAMKETRQRVERGLSSLKATGRDLAAAQKGDVPAANELADARGERDVAVVELVTAWLQGRPPAETSDLPTRVERTMSRADTVADRLVAHADTAARRAELTKTLSQQEAEHAETVRDLATDAENVQNAHAGWRTLWHNLGDAVPDPADASEVRRHLDAARTAQEDMTASQSRHRDLQQQVGSQVTALAAALAQAGHPRPDFDLDSLLEAAGRLLADADSARESRAAIKQLTRLEDEDRRRRDLAASALAAIQARWQALLRSLDVADDLDFPGWCRRRDLVGEARTLQQEADAHRYDADEAQHRNKAFLEAVMALAEHHDKRVDDDVAAVIASLAQRFDTARSSRSRAEDLDRRIAQLQDKVQDAQSSRANALDRLESLLAAAEISDLEELDRAAERARILGQLTAEAERLAGLVRAAAPNADLDAFVEELTLTEPEVLEIALASAREDQTSADADLKETLTRHAQAVQKERDLTTSEGSAELHARAQEHLAMVAERVERYLVARIQSDVLLGELEAYERKHASPLLDEAGVLLERLTGGRYVALGVTDGPSGRGLAIIGANEERRGPSQLSEGTADQVFLALRLAGIASLQEERRASGELSLPVVLDDVLMAFDDERAAAALRVMAELSQQWQVIVFSHHAHLADLADSLSLDALTVSRLVPPPEMDVLRTGQQIRLRARSAPSAMSAAPPRAAAPRSSDSTVSRTAGATDAGAVRAWARNHGYAVGDRGRMGAEIIAAYELAHP